MDVKPRVMGIRVRLDYPGRSLRVNPSSAIANDVTERIYIIELQDPKRSIVNHYHDSSLPASSTIYTTTECMLTPSMFSHYAVRRSCQLPLLLQLRSTQCGTATVPVGPRKEAGRKTGRSEAGRARTMRRSTLRSRSTRVIARGTTAGALTLKKKKIAKWLRSRGEGHLQRHLFAELLLPGRVRGQHQVSGIPHQVIPIHRLRTRGELGELQRQIPGT